MAVITTLAYSLLQAGEYLARVTAIYLENGIYGPQFRWDFELLNAGELTGRSVKAWTSTSANLKGKFIRWAGACLGREIGLGERLDTDTLIGSVVTLVLGVKEGTDGGQFPKVEDVKPCAQQPAVLPTKGDDPF